MMESVQRCKAQLAIVVCSMILVTGATLPRLATKIIAHDKVRSGCCKAHTARGCACAGQR